MSGTSHVVLGGNGVVGRETLRALVARGHTPVSVGRHPSPEPGTTSSVGADLLDRDDVSRALRGAAVAYFVPGLPYSSRLWAAQWPVLVRNAIDAALENETHLVYLDNVYAYGRVDGPMTESSRISPRSKKGRVRADALDLLRDASERGLTVTIGRSADFYGPGATTSVFNSFVIDKIVNGKTPTWLFDADQAHSLTYTPDIGNALAILGEARGTARGGTWHLPTAPALTGREYVRLAAGPDARVAVLGTGTMRMGAVFNTAARETLEMSYQYTAPYVFESAAFEAAFGVAPTPAAEGIAAALAASPVRRSAPTRI